VQPVPLGGGLDAATGGAVRDVFDYDYTSHSLPGSANRDVIIDFAHNSDKIDLAGIAADATHAGNQAFVWLATRHSPARVRSTSSPRVAILLSRSAPTRTVPPCG
jgi:hypothetical protein